MEVIHSHRNPATNVFIKEEMEIQILNEIKPYEALIEGMASSLARAHANRSRSPSNALKEPLVGAQIRQKKAEIAAISQSTAARIHALALLSEGFKHAYITQRKGLSDRALSRLKKKAFERGFWPEDDPRILEDYVVDAPCSGRPKEITQEKEQALLDSVRKNRAGREKSSEVLAYEQNISLQSALRILKKHNLRPVKTTKKPGLSAA
jgi:hypothetical protein